MREIKIYTFEELTEENQKKAIENYRYSDYRFLDVSEIKESYQRITALIYDPLEELKNDMSFYCDYDVYPGDIKGVRLYTWIINNLSYLWTDRIAITKKLDDSIIFDDFSYKYENKKSMWSSIMKVNNLEDYFLTGVCYDNALLTNFIDFVKSPKLNTNLNDLISGRTTLESVIKTEEEYFNSNEYIKEELPCVDIEFFEDGSIYK